MPGHDLPVAVHDVPQRPAEVDQARQHAVLRDGAAEVGVLLLAELLILEVRLMRLSEVKFTNSFTFI